MLITCSCVEFVGFLLQAQNDYSDIDPAAAVVLEPVLVGPQSGGASQSRTGAEVAVATLELIDQAQQRSQPDHVLVTLSVGECVQLLNLPATHPCARLNNTYVFVDRPRPSAANAAARLVPVIEAVSGQRFEVPYACVRRVPVSDAPYTAVGLACITGEFIMLVAIA